jgi:hypothetical protein
MRKMHKDSGRKRGKKDRVLSRGHSGAEESWG